MTDYITRLLEGESVEWRTLGEVCDYVRGLTYNKHDEVHKGEGWTVLRANNINLDTRSLVLDDIKVVSYDTPTKPQHRLRKGDVLICAGSGSREHVGKTAYISEDTEMLFGGFMGVLRTNESVLNSRYLFHVLGGTAFRDYLGRVLASSTINNLNASIMNTFRIPIPPLRVQRRIVEILDAFSALTAELEAELEGRRRQYAHYREQQLALPDAPRLPLGEIGSVRMCKRILKEQTQESGEVPFYKIGTFGKEPNAYISRELFEEYKSKYSYPKVGDILISASGTIGKTVIFDGQDAYFQDSNIVWIEHDERQVLNKFLYYCYQEIKWDVAEGGTIQRLYNDGLRKATIPIPPLEEQRRIVDILDRFSTLCESITEGLPREIELRRQQYEYYREQLLTFPQS